MSTARGARARARIEVTAAIKEEARRQLAAEGAAKLSLRAVARELGMVSSALYRYFPSRDDLLTALIIDAYDSLGESAEAAHAQVAGAGPLANAGSRCAWRRAVGPWRNRTSTRSSTVRPCPATPRRTRPSRPPPAWGCCWSASCVTRIGARGWPAPRCRPT